MQNAKNLLSLFFFLLKYKMFVHILVLSQPLVWIFFFSFKFGLHESMYDNLKT